MTKLWNARHIAIKEYPTRKENDRMPLKCPYVNQIQTLRLCIETLVGGCTASSNYSRMCILYLSMFSRTVCDDLEVCHLGHGSCPI